MKWSHYNEWNHIIFSISFWYCHSQYILIKLRDDEIFSMLRWITKKCRNNVNSCLVSQGSCLLVISEGWYEEACKIDNIRQSHFNLLSQYIRYRVLWWCRYNQRKLPKVEMRKKTCSRFNEGRKVFFLDIRLKICIKNFFIL